MKWFDYENPKTLLETLELLNSCGDDSRLMAGGTDLIVQMRIGRRTPKIVINTKSIDEMNELTCSSSGLTIGAAVPCYKIYQTPEIISMYPGIIDSASLIGGIQIQGRATFGGNLCNAAPSADSIPALIVNRAICNIASTEGTRSIPVEDFCTGPGQNILNSNELLVSLSLPKHESNFGSRYIRFTPRNEMDIAVAGAGVSITLENEIIKSIHVALSSVAPTPLLVKKITEELTGTKLSPKTLSHAGEFAQQAATPITDMRGTVEYRKHLTGVLTKRALTDAIKRAKGEKVNGR